MPEPTLDEFDHVLGFALQRVRERAGITRTELVKKMGHVVGPQAVRNYELGQHALTVRRLLQLCAALDVRPLDIFTEASTTVLDDPAPLRIDLRLLAATADPSLQAIRMWASHTVLSAKGVFDLEPKMLGPLATLCDLTSEQLAKSLEQFRTNKTTRRKP